MKKRTKIILGIASIAILSIGFCSYYYNKIRKQKQLMNECEIVTTKSFMITFGSVKDIHGLCKNIQLQKLYDQNKKNSLGGATLEAHQRIAITCDCAVRNLYKNITTPWIDKCLHEDMSWISEPVKLNSVFKQHPENKLLLIESSYESCEYAK